MTDRRYFTEQDARNLIGRRVIARVAISRTMLRAVGLWVAAGGRGTVTQFASGCCYTGNYFVGIAWDDPRPSIPRRALYPIDWYNWDDFRDLLEHPLDEAA